MAPKVIPKTVADIKEEELPPPSSGAVGVVGGVPGGVPGGTPGGVIGGIIGSVPSAAPPPPPPPPPPVKKEEPKVTRIRVGGNVQQAMLVRQPRPVYPPLAKQARIQGVVRLNAIIGKDGTIQNLTVAAGHPLLVPAALEAVKQWVYKPTLLNGEPVEVVTQIDVNFTLSQ
jgi:periplasmic protein TonB